MPVCQLCTSEQMESADYGSLCLKLGLIPSTKHRKAWEFVYLLAVLRAKGCLMPGNRGLGFGTGSEPLPSTLANMGLNVTATDAPADDLGFQETRQWTSAVADLYHPNLVSAELFDKHVEYRPADMNAIPASLRGYDFCWSACCLEHLGSLRHGLDFIRNSLDTLRPGGIAVHTTEFNLLSNDRTLETPGCSIFRKRDFEALSHELSQDGHRMEPLNFWPGVTPVDEHIDIPPWGSPHLKLELQGCVTTSIGITVTKAGPR